MTKRRPTKKVTARTRRPSLWSTLHSKATNAYDHLSWVRQLILDEPKRYNQKQWIVGPKVILPSYITSPQSIHTPQGLPACNTVACVAGWTVASFQRTYPRKLETIATKAKNILGLTNAEADELFDGDAVLNLYLEDHPDCYSTDEQPPTPQTPKYAALGAEHIRRFQQRYKKQLMSTRLPGR